jgi:hypothetical protein
VDDTAERLGAMQRGGSTLRGRGMGPPIYGAARHRRTHHYSTPRGRRHYVVRRQPLGSCLSRLNFSPLR